MRACAALVALFGSAAASGIPTASPTGSPVGQCPPHSAVADVRLGAGMPPAVPLHMASDPQTGEVSGAPWMWIPQDNVMLKSFREADCTLKCGNYYGYQCRRTENNTVFSVDCKSQVCDVYAFIYHEPPRSTQSNGRLPLTLPANDWETGSCAPQFCMPVPTDAPSASTEAPTQSTMAPTQSTMAPTQSTMAPTQSTMAPTESTAAPTKATIPPVPAPVTNAPSMRVVASGNPNPDVELPDARKAGALDAQTPMECCRMTAFRKQVSSGNAVSFTIDEAFGVMDAYYLVIAVAPGQMCGSNERQTSQAACEECPQFGNAQCRWVEGEGGAVVPQARKAGALQINPTLSPTASPVGGRCVSNWCPRRAPQPPREAPPMCSAPLTEPECQAPPARPQ